VKKGLLVIVLGLSVSAQAATRGGSRSLGSGIAFAAPNHSLSVNPAALPDSFKLSVEGLYFTQNKDFHASVVGNMGTLGLGAAWRQEGAANIYEAGFGVAIGKLSIGSTLRKVGSGGLDGDVGITLDLSKVRVASVLRSLSGSPDRWDAGIGVNLGAATFEFDVKKQWPLDSDGWAFDAGLVVDVQMISVGLGYTFSHSAGGWHDGDIHAGLSVMVFNSIFLEGFYRPNPQEWGVGDYGVGARAVF
jgi:hypothetical protein